MTWGGGKPHAVGDRGQRYAITYADQNGVRQVFGWCDKLEGAMSMAHSVMLHPTWNRVQVRDRSRDPDLERE